MRVEIISGAAAFAKLRPKWDEVYAADPNAQLFLSWRWLSGWLPLSPDPWSVLAAKDEKDGSDEFVAFWPIRVETRVNEQGVLFNDVKMAGNHVADYTGFICRPDSEHRVIPAFARKLRELGWARLVLDNFAGTDAQLRLLLAHLSQPKLTIEHVARVNKADGVDVAVCPYADLPRSFEDYLTTLSANTRQKLRRLLRKVDVDRTYQVTVATAETVRSDLDTLFGFWRKRWASVKGIHTDDLVRSNRAMLMRSWQLGLLYLPTIRLGDRPLAALAILVDPVKRSYLFFNAGRDEAFEGPPLGLLLHAHSIRHAIASGFTRYDFLRGDEAYKYSFTAKQRRIHCVYVRTRSGGNLANHLYPTSREPALNLITRLHRSAKFSEAERGYRQILGSWPDDAETLYRYAQLLMTMEKYAVARSVCTKLVRINSEAPRAWLLLAQAYEALGQRHQAERAYRCVAAIAPDWPEIRDRIGDSETAAPAREDSREAV